MIELLSLVCLFATAIQGECIPEGINQQGEKKVLVSDSYEQMVAPGAYQLSYSANGRKLDTTALTAHWNQRAAELCKGKYSGYPISQTQYPDSTYDSIMSSTFIPGNSSFNVETYGVAYCDNPTG